MRGNQCIIQWAQPYVHSILLNGECGTCVDHIMYEFVNISPSKKKEHKKENERQLNPT